jgi:hypothetical protein
MTDAQTLSLTPGTIIAHTCNGHVSRYRIREITAAGRCDNPRSGAHGHAYACFRGDWLLNDGGTMDVSTSLHSDEYGDREGYPTHDRAGARIRGWEIVA